jgi:DNA segregation ATPase FtsK/SpoIIIE, S-DNA-T family
MRATVTVVAAGGAVREDARIEAPGSAPVGELLAKLRQLVAEPGDHAPAIGGVAVEPGQAAAVGTLTPFAGSGLRDGAIVSFASPQQPTPRACYLELRVVGGPAAGTVHPLPVGTSSLGRAGTAAIRIDDPDVSRRHAVITVAPDGVTVADDGSTNGTALDGQRLTTSPVAMRPGMRLGVGQSTLVVTVPHVAPVAVTKTSDGRLSFNRPPRLDVLGADAGSAGVTFPAPPVERAPNTLPVVATVSPLLAGVLLAVVMRRPEYLLFTIVSPLMMAGQWAADRVGQRRAHRVEQTRYASALTQAQETLSRALADNVVGRRRRAPDPAALSMIAVVPGARLWERRRGDIDFLVVSLGSATLPAELAVTCAPSGVSTDLHDVPATVVLSEVGVLGIAGPPPTTEAIARSIIGQLAVLHSPRELAIVLMTEPARVESWDWMPWLPHVRPSDDLFGAACDALVGLDADSNAARAGELAALIETRRHAVTVGPRQLTEPRAIVVVVDGAWALRRTRALATVLAHGPAVGVFAVCIDDAESRLPAECSAVAVTSTQNRLRLRTPGKPAAVDIAADGVSIRWAEGIARALAPVRDDSPDRSDTMPDTVRWLDIAKLGVDLTDTDLTTASRLDGVKRVRARRRQSSVLAPTAGLRSTSPSTGRTPSSRAQPVRARASCSRHWLPHSPWPIGSTISLSCSSTTRAAPRSVRAPRSRTPWVW